MNAIKNSKWILLLLVAVVVIAALWILLDGRGNSHDPDDTDNPSGTVTDLLPDTGIQIGWTIRGPFAKFYSTGDMIDVSLTGTIREIPNGQDELRMVFAFPDRFPYQLDTKDPCFISTNRMQNDLPYLYISHCDAYNKHTGTSTRCIFALSLEKSCLMMLFEDAPNCYLTAAADADTQQLLTYFNEFIECCAWGFWWSDEDDLQVSTRIDQTLHAVKTDAEGNELGTFQIHMRGVKLDDRSGHTKLDMVISPFDSLTSFQPSTDGTTGTEGNIHNFPLADVSYVIYSAWNTDENDMVMCEIGFSPDLDKWIILDYATDTFYVGSVNGTHTTQELIEYFGAQIPTNWYSS